MDQSEHVVTACVTFLLLCAYDIPLYIYYCSTTSLYTYMYSVVHSYVVHRHHCANLALQAEVSNSIGTVCNSVHYVLW